MVEMSSIKEKIEKLWIDTADAKPENYDFYDKQYGEDWDIPFEQTEEEMENEEFAPMMNYRYPLPDFDQKGHSSDEIKKALSKAGSVTLVEDLKSGEKYLALSGGGMDLSWDIVQAYVNLGFTPPAHFCRRLPRMAGMSLTSGNRNAIMGCRRSLKAQSGWNEQGLKELDETEARLKAERTRRSQEG